MNKPPITYFQGFIHPEHFFPLWEYLPWEKREGAPRRECWMNDYDLPYTYGSGVHARTYQPMPQWHPFIDMLRGILNEPANHNFDCCFVNGYEDERQSLGWHADDSPEMDHDHPIAVVSFGAERDIMFREAPRGVSHRHLLENGSLLLMHAGMQRDWQHRIPKAGHKCGPRLSLTFRKLVR